MSEASVDRRHLALKVLRYLPTGLLVPVLVLLVTSRGFTLAEFGLAAAMQGLLVVLLEVPTGGLADTVGRRPVLVAGSTVNVVSMLLFALVADTLLLLAVVFALQGVFRALESGPLDAWYVDAKLAEDPDADIETGLSRASAVVSAALGAGSLLSSGIVAVVAGSVVEPLAVPVLLAAGLGVVEIAALLALMDEVRAPDNSTEVATRPPVATVVREALGLVRRSRSLVLLLVPTVPIGVAAVSWESLVAPRLETLVGEADRAARLLGPMNTLAFAASAVAAALVPRLSRRWGPHLTAGLLRLAQVATVAVMAVSGALFGVGAAYVVTLALHVASMPVHQGLVHRQVDSAHRTTVLSVNSLGFLASASLGGIALGALADATSPATAMLVGVSGLTLCLPAYLAARRSDTALAADAAGVVHRGRGD